MIRRDYYQVLGLAQSASATDIRAAFVRLSKRHHPDLAGGDDALSWRLQDVQQAYHCLSDPASRAAHDRALADERRQHFARQRAVQKRLHRFDRRHPQPVPRAYPRRRWRRLAIAAVLTVLVARIGVWLIG